MVLIIDWPNNRTSQKLNADCGWLLFIVGASSRCLQSPGGIQHPGFFNMLEFQQGVYIPKLSSQYIDKSVSGKCDLRSCVLLYNRTI